MHPKTCAYFIDNHIKYDFGEILSSADISEDDHHWPVLKQLLEAEHNTYLSETAYDKSELSAAEWLTVRSRWYFDYPQPENEYLSITYNTDNLCSERWCGMELIQKDSFRFKKTPKWGKRNFCMTNWVWDELFVSAKAKELLESSDLTGCSFAAVKSKNGSTELNDIYQLQIPHILEPGISNQSECIDKKIFVCPKCGKQKYRKNGRGRLAFNKGIFTNAPDFSKSNEWFGGGANAVRALIVSHNAYQFIIDHQLDGSLVFEPIIIC